eukprot:scaffold31396_cov72-Phaeocystis_antarctica.AAC.2
MSSVRPMLARPTSETSCSAAPELGTAKKRVFSSVGLNSSDTLVAARRSPPAARSRSRSRPTTPLARPRRAARRSAPPPPSARRPLRAAPRLGASSRPAETWAGSASRPLPRAAPPP